MISEIENEEELKEKRPVPNVNTEDENESETLEKTYEEILDPRFKQESECDQK